MDIYEEIFEDNRDALPPEFESMTADDVLRRIRMLDNEIRVLKDESTRLSLEQSGLKEKVSLHVVRFCMHDVGQWKEGGTGLGLDAGLALGQ